MPLQQTIARAKLTDAAQTPVRPWRLESMFAKTPTLPSARGASADVLQSVKRWGGDHFTRWSPGLKLKRR
jgi:hypothetical protein